MTQSASLAVEASPGLLDLLTRLHAESEAQEKTFFQAFFYWKRRISYYLTGTSWTSAADSHMLDKFVSLEQDKCHLMYLLARSMGARNIVEAGTSFGVSTMYLALAVGQNIAALQAAGDESASGKVIATEKEPTKAERAKKHWSEAGTEVEPWIDLRVGDLLEKLKVEEGMPKEVDMLLLDIWTPMALPTLKIIQPRLRRGAIVLTDNTISSKALYKEHLDYLHDPQNGFKTMTLPFSNGFELSVYLP